MTVLATQNLLILMCTTTYQNLGGIGVTLNESNGPESNGPSTGVTLTKFVCGLNPMRTRWIRHFWIDAAELDHNHDLIRWTNGTTNHLYQTTNSPTSRGKYRWMIFTSALYCSPLWYCVTNTTMPSSMNKFRNRPCMVLLCLTLNISGPRAGWPPVMCINANN